MIVAPDPLKTKKKPVDTSSEAQTPKSTALRTALGLQPLPNAEPPIKSEAEQVGHNIRRMRKAKGLTILEASERLGLSDVTLSNIERGKCNITLKRLLHISRTFNYPLRVLLEGVL